MSLWSSHIFWSETLIGTFTTSYDLLDAIKAERDHMTPISEFKNLSNEEKLEYVEREKNIAFATIGAFCKNFSFIYSLGQNMLTLGVPTNDVKNFISKWSAFYSLSQEVTDQLLVFKNDNEC